MFKANPWGRFRFLLLLILKIRFGSDTRSTFTSILIVSTYLHTHTQSPRLKVVQCVYIPGVVVVQLIYKSGHLNKKYNITCEIFKAKVNTQLPREAQHLIQLPSICIGKWNLSIHLVQANIKKERKKEREKKEVCSFFFFFLQLSSSVGSISRFQCLVGVLVVSVGGRISGLALLLQFWFFKVQKHAIVHTETNNWISLIQTLYEIAEALLQNVCVGHQSLFIRSMNSLHSQ